MTNEYGEIEADQVCIEYTCPILQKAIKGRIDHIAGDDPYWTHVECSCSEGYHLVALNMRKFRA
jgi:hypothetical protein